MTDVIASGRKKKKANGLHDGGRLGFEEKLWRAADRLRGHVEPAEYKHVVLGLIFLRFVLEGRRVPVGGKAANARKKPLRSSLDLFSDNSSAGTGSQSLWRKVVQRASVENVRDVLRKALKSAKEVNSELAGFLDGGFMTVPPKPLMDLLAVIDELPLEDGASKATDVLGRVYEYFLAQFASSEGRSGGEYYTPRSVVQLLVDMVQPFKGKVYDPCCGTAGMFVQSEQFVIEHGALVRDKTESS